MRIYVPQLNKTTFLAILFTCVLTTLYMLFAIGENIIYDLFFTSLLFSFLLVFFTENILSFIFPRIIISIVILHFIYMIFTQNVLYLGILTCFLILLTVCDYRDRKKETKIEVNKSEI